ncbi:MAG: hypothetical protein NVS4B12_08650 [Ktedonobacteraceae bacterium]
MDMSEFRVLPAVAQPFGLHYRCLTKVVHRSRLAKRPDRQIRVYRETQVSTYDIWGDNLTFYT